MAIIASFHKVYYTSKCLRFFLKQLSCVFFCLMPFTYLAWLIEAYLEEFFFVLYDVSMTPKLHYLVHLPKQISL